MTESDPQIHPFLDAAKKRADLERAAREAEDKVNKGLPSQRSSSSFPSPCHKNGRVDGSSKSKSSSKKRKAGTDSSSSSTTTNQRPRNWPWAAVPGHLSYFDSFSHRLTQQMLAGSLKDSRYPCAGPHTKLDWSVELSLLFMAVWHV